MLECTQIPGQWTPWSGSPTHLLGIWKTWLWPPLLLFIIWEILLDQRAYIITRLVTTKLFLEKKTKLFLEKKAGLVVGGNVSRAREGGARRAAIQWWRAEGEEPGTRNWLGGGRGGAIALVVQVPERGALVPKRENEGENNYIVAQRRGVNRSLGKIPLHSVLENLAWK